VAFDPTLSLVCLLNGIGVAKAMAAHPMMERLNLAICRIGGMINDIISFPKETHEDCHLGQYHNFIAANFYENKDDALVSKPLQRAIDDAFAFHNHEFQDVVAIGDAVAAEDPELRRYVDIGLAMHRSWMSWCLSSDRYASAVRPVASGVRAERPVRIVWPDKSSASSS